MSKPLIEKTYEKEQSDLLSYLFKLVTKTEAIEERLLKTSPHIYAVYRKRQILLPYDYVNLIETLEKEVVNNPFPEGIIFEPNGLFLVPETRYNEDYEETYLTNPLIFLYEEPYLRTSVFELIETDELAIIIENGSTIVITHNYFQKNKYSYKPFFEYNVQVYNLNVNNLYYEVTGINPKEYVSLRTNKIPVASFENLLLCSDGTILEDGEEVGKIDISRKSKLGKFNFLKYLMIKQGRERSNKLVPQEEITANVGGNDFEKMYSKINNENLKDSSYKISKSGTGYMIKRK